MQWSSALSDTLVPHCRGLPITRLVIGYIGLFIVYWISNMCKYVADTDIHKHLFMGTHALVLS